MVYQLCKFAVEMRIFGRILLIVILITAGILVAWWYLIPAQQIKAYELIPNSAAIIFEFEKPLGAWRTLQNNRIWQDLSQSDIFQPTVKTAQWLDSILKSNQTLLNILGEKPLIISIHKTSEREYDLLYILDLQNESKIGALAGLIGPITSQWGYQTRQRTIQNNSVIELYDPASKTTLHLTLIGNQLCMSYTGKLVDMAIKTQSADNSLNTTPGFEEIIRNVGNDGLFRMFIQHSQYNELADLFLKNNPAATSEKQANQNDNTISTIEYSGGVFELKDNLIKLSGEILLNPKKPSYLLAATLDGSVQTQIPKLLPEYTGAFLTLSFSDFTQLYQSLNRQHELEDPKQHKKTITEIQKIEKFLKFNLEKDFISWIGNEITLASISLQRAETPAENKPEFVLIIKSKDRWAMEKNIEKLMKSIRKRTPLKVEEFEYRGYEINYFGLKGFFKLFLGKFFDRFEIPYFVKYNEYLIFCNSATVLTECIEAITENRTLEKATHFKKIMPQLLPNCNLLIYLNPEKYFDALHYWIRPEKTKSLFSNKPYICSLSEIIVQVYAERKKIISHLIINYQKYIPEPVE
jgi:hypothetical protein